MKKHAFIIFIILLLSVTGVFSQQLLTPTNSTKPTGCKKLKYIPPTVTQEKIRVKVQDEYTEEIVIKPLITQDEVIEITIQNGYWDWDATLNCQVWIPSITRQIIQKTVIQAREVRIIHHPAKWETITKNTVTGKGRMEWVEVDCN